MSGQESKNTKEPVAAVKPEKLIIHDDTRVDNYYWLNQRENPEVIKYLEEENAWLESKLSHTQKLQEKIYNEITGRIKQVDASVPYKKNGYFYYNRYTEGKEYPIYARKIDSLDSKEEVLIDGNHEAIGKAYFALGTYSISPDNQTMAYSEDTFSRRIYTIKIKNLTTNQFIDDNIPNTEGNIIWFEDGKSFLYTTKDAQTLRTDKVFQHFIGTKADEDKLIFEEKDETFSLSINKSRSGQFIYITSYSTLTNEIHYVSSLKSQNQFQIFLPRKRDHLYFIRDNAKNFYILSNENAINFKLFQTDINHPEKSAWKEYIPHRPNVLVEDIHCFQDFNVIEERIEGIVKLRTITNEKDYYIPFEEESYSVGLQDNHEFLTNKIRYVYTSLTTPSSVYDYDLNLDESELLKMQEVVGGYDPKEYLSERVLVKVRDGVTVPVSLIYKKSLYTKGKNPLLLYGYGSYGYSLDPTFSSVRLSLLDRGFVFAIAHIRGGQELGRQWYEDGKLLKKKNTFYDFIDCGKALVKQKFGASEKLYAMGGSAGGLLMGTVINLEPKMFKGVVAAVPFVDVVTTMLDESIPLTTGEFDEWGNPKDKKYYEYIKSYSPYDNVAETIYPALLVTTGLHDSQVQYWEPAKWVAKLRELRKGQTPLYLYTNMSTGHGGASGRFAKYKEAALEYAFLLDLEGIGD